MTRPAPEMVQDAVRELQIRVWDRADDPRFRLTIYEPLREGKKVGSVGGLKFLDYVGAYAKLGPEHSVLEFGSGMGDACEYIAEHFGSRVTGVEIGTQQIERARERHGDSRSRGYEFVQADFLNWQPPERYDAVYFLEMLPIIEDCRTLLEKIHSWLKPGGALAMSDIVVGPAGLTDEDREFLWVEDGVVHSLPSVEERLTLIQDVGFRQLEVTDITDAGIMQNERILEESYRHKEEIVEGVGIDSWLNWVECAQVYGRYFVERKLVCLRIGARRV
ncbi:MAG TPA: methyltransferase domain-containing protein [Pyrinomonadaceae bacterium]|nr:methyltransferase domain-containing protein [Pyrinomonadaceae bacterium]